MLSIIIVKYKAEKELQECIESLAKTKVKKEIIVIDNNEINRGYARGNNLGASFAKGEFLMILNPDTVVLPGAIDKMIEWLNNHPDCSIVSPRLVDENHVPYRFQGTSKLTPLHGIWGLSFLNKVFLDRIYWLPRSVEVVPGTALMMRTKDFVGFDEKFFLYFEEADLCMRTPRKKYILKEAEVIHYWGRSTPENIKPIFVESRFYYFRKHYGILWATLVHLICSLSKKNIAITLIFLIGVWLRLSSPFVFFDDARWFYASARGALFGQFPLLGITASITWLHQGPLWTYLYIPALWLSNFSPVSGSVPVNILNILFIPTFYYLLSVLFNKKIALINIIIVWLLPWWIFHSGLAYHTSLIPLFEVIFLLCLIKQRDFLVGLFLGFLYQLHLLTFIFWPLLLRSKILNLRSILGFMLGILPFLVSGPTQTFGIFIWITKHLFEGFGGTGLASEAYRVVLFVPTLVLLNYFVKIVIGYAHRFNTH